MQKQDITPYQFILRKAFLCMLFVGLMLCFSASALSESQLFLGQEAYVEISDVTDIQWFVFIPEENGEYIFSSSGMADAVGYLFDADFNSITWSSSGSQGGNFHLICELRAGTLYNFAASGNVSFYVMLCKNNESLNGDNWTLNNGVLTFSGAEPIPEYGSGSAPWHDQYVTSVVIGNGVSRIPAHTFSGLQQLTSVSISGSVIEIGDGAFSGCSSLESVSIPSSVSNIGPEAFEYCTGLTELTFPASLRTIGENAFSECVNLQRVTFENGIASIGPSAFKNCSNLFEVNLPDSLTSIGGEAFSGDFNLTIISIPDSAHLTGPKAFTGCDKLLDSQGFIILDHLLVQYTGNSNNIEISTGVTKIADYAFYGYSVMASVQMPETVTAIGDFAFALWENQLFSINIPSSVSSISPSSFYGTETPSEWGVSSTFIIQNGILTKYIGTDINPIIPSSVTSIGFRAFYEQNDLASVTVPSSVTSIRDEAFKGCSSLANVYYSGSWEQWNNITIGSSNDPLLSASINYASVEIDSGNCGTGLTWTYSDGTLTISGIGSMDDYTQRRTAPWAEYCSKIRTIKVNEGVISIGNYAFYNCSQLSNITLPNNLEMIGAYFLYGCSTLSSVTLPDTVTSIGAYAFGRCEQLQNVTLSESLRTIGNCAFEGCTSLTGLSLPDSVNSIGYAAFRETGLRWIRLSINVTSMGDNVFESCPDLAEVTWPSSMPTVPANTFSYEYSPNQITEMILPEGVASIGENAFSAATKLKVLYLPLTLKKVNSGAFSNCSELTDVYYAGTVEKKKEILISTENSYLSTALWHYTEGNQTEPYASGTCGANLTWTLDDMGILTISGSGRMTNYSYNTIPWYSDRTMIKSVVISEGVTNIDSYAFYGCSELTSITVPNSITSIGSYAFYGCSGLKTAGPIGGGYDYEFGWINSISDYAFSNCSGLTSITIPNSITSIGSHAFSYCSSLTSITIPNRVTSINSFVFSYCPSLTSVIIPNSVIFIDSYAFSGCSSLTSITIPQSIISIGTSAFSGCSSLTSVTIPNNVRNIYNDAFSGCSGLTSVSILGSTTSVSYGAFSGCSRLKTAGPIGGGYDYEFGWTSSIPDRAFSNCSSLTSITIPNSVTCIEELAFDDCSSLTSIIIPNSVTSIGICAFRGCSNLTSINIPSTVTSIGSSAFYNCSSLTSITIPNSVTSIGGYAFYNCSGLKTAGPIGGGYDYEFGWIDTIPEYAFYSCSGLISVTIPNSVTSIGSYAFYSCSRLTSVTIPNSVISIGSYAFSNCSGLISVNIPNSVTMGTRVFAGCTNLIDSDGFIIHNHVLYGYTGSATINSANKYCNSVTKVI